MCNIVCVSVCVFVCLMNGDLKYITDKILRSIYIRVREKHIYIRVYLFISHIHIPTDPLLDYVYHTS